MTDHWTTDETRPNFYVPGILGTNIIRGDIERMMHAVLAHLERQPALPN